MNREETVTYVRDLVCDNPRIQSYGEGIAQCRARTDGNHESHIRHTLYYAILAKATVDVILGLVNHMEEASNSPFINDVVDAVYDDIVCDDKFMDYTHEYAEQQTGTNGCDENHLNYDLFWAEQRSEGIRILLQVAVSLL